MPLFLLLLVLYPMSIFAQDRDSVTSFKIYSTILKEDRFFEVYIPPSAKGKLEVIYVLDGQAQFVNVTNALKQQGLNQKIIVGIGNIWLRDRDYTPTHVNASPFIDSMAAAVSGGGKNFVAHLEKELIPYINTHYAADTSRILIGHSYGGLIAMDILLNHTALFRKYLVIDPSMWWDDSKLVKQSRELLKKKFPPTFLYLAIANSTSKDKIDAIRKDTTQNTAMVRPTFFLLEYLETGLKNYILSTWKFYKDHDHMSVFLPAVNDGLKFLLRF